ncbi:MAG: ATP-binding protein, partial [Saprospiraceae bacterium]|nr:ATP-binding protein [Saprospiraceae bacterium]
MNTNHIRTLLKNDKVKEALESLSALTDRSSHNDYAIMLYGRFSRWELAQVAGIAQPVDRLQIIDAALTFCNVLDADKDLSHHDNFRQQIDISHLPPLQPHFVGREEELKLLDQCWQNPQANLLEFIAPGGTGKTTLVTWWLLHRLPNLEEQPEAIFAFSFYSQGTGDHRQSSSDPFFSQANAFFGVQNPPTDPRERARALVEAIRARKAILVLDGIEPLQYPPGPLEGQLKDP